MIAYSVALARSGVRVLERTASPGCGPTDGAVTGVETSGGPISTPLVVLTGGPRLAAVGALAGIRIPAGGVRHQVAVTEPHPDLAPDRLPMVFDLRGRVVLAAGGGRDCSSACRTRTSRRARRAASTCRYLELMRERLAELVPVTAGLGLSRMWAATIDYTPDHLPIIGPALISASP